MAMSKPLGENIDKLTCTLCLELYKSPKVLPCLHTFCEQCLEKFISSLGPNKEGLISQFRCPICMTKVNPFKKYTEVKEWISDFPSNTILKLMLFQHEGMRIECDSCRRADETSDAKVWCPSCVDSLCDICEKMHKRMKMLKDHQLIALEEISAWNKGLDFSAISEYCPYHPRKELDHFCTDHDQICCSVCIRSNHKNCETILIEDTQTADLSYLPDKLTNVKDNTSKLLEDRKQQKAKLKSYTYKVKEDAASFTENLKSRLDNLLEVFNKEVNILQEEEETELNVAIRQVEQILSALEHWMNLLEKVPENASETKRFQIGKTIKKQLCECIEELSLHMIKPDIDGLKFDTCIIGGVVKGIESLDKIGSLVASKSCASDKLTHVQAICESSKIVLIPSFENFSVKFKRNITVDGMDFIFGTCSSQRDIIVGDEGRKIAVLSKDTGDKLYETAGAKSMRSICFDERNNRFYLSSHSYPLVTFVLTDTGLKSQVLLRTKDVLGGICCQGGQVFLVNEGSVLTFNSTNRGESLKQCFTANTDCNSVGLAVHDGSLYYTTKDNEIKCASIEGTEMFSFKSPTIAKPHNLAVLSSGLVLVVDASENGKLHLLSADGKKYKILLDKFENVKSPKDLWLDSDGTTFYVCGGNNIDVYKIQ